MTETEIDLAIAAVWITIVIFNSGLWYRMGYKTGRLDEKLARSQMWREHQDNLDAMQAMSGVHPISRGPQP